MPSKARHLVAALLITAVALVMYSDVLFLSDPAIRYPWSSDAWGHLIKADYLLEQIEQGDWYPDLFPQWYNGQQMLRYYAPLPYYGLAGLLPVSGDTFAAGNWFLFLAALFGGLSMLLFARRFGLVFATIGGIMLLLLPDNIRVAFAEGNLPRVLAASLLPAMFFFYLNLLTGEGNRRLPFVGTAVLVSLTILSHAMMGAIFGVCLALFAVVYWLTASGSVKSVGLAILALFTGALLAGWWLLPSLTGGITDLNVEAASEALARFPWNVSFNPLLRVSNKEAYYIGVSLLIPLVLLMFYWRRVDGLVKSLFIASFITLLISSTLFNDLYTALPFNQLFWPLRYMTFTGFLLILSAIALLSSVWRLSGPRAQSVGRFVVVGLVLVVLLDFWQSTPLIRTRDVPPEVQQVAELLRDSDGWRVATADLSQLGSSPSYLFSTVGGKEQVYGWAYQGAITSPVLAMINQAIEKGYPAFAIDRLERLGADSIVVLNTTPQSVYKISPEFRQALPEAGYEVRFRGNRMNVYQRDGAPRVYKVETSIFAIGSGAQNLALLFPEVLAATDTTLDNYSLDFLSEFDTLVLTGFDWNDKGKAEEMVRELAGKGQRIMIDLTGSPVEVFSRIPEFLDVYGERVLLTERPILSFRGTMDERTELLRPFEVGYPSWKAVVPQGLDTEDITFDFRGVTGAVLGGKSVGESSVKFLGLNLIFHAVLTGDPVAIDILERELDIQANRRPTTAVPMIGYTATQEGYQFSLDISEPGSYIVPVAYHAGTVVYVDGQETPSVAIDNLPLIRLSAGTHSVEIKSLTTRVYLLGQAATGLGVLLVAATLLAGTGILHNGIVFLQRKPRARESRL